jgi:hypothetical protein
MRRLCAALASVVLGAGAALRPAGAQQAADVRCRSGSAVFEDACQLTADLYAFLAPQLSAAVSAGAPAMGTPAVDGGWWSLGGRLNLVDAAVPALGLAAIDTGRATPANLPVSRIPLPMPSAEASARLPITVGGWRGAVHLLASVHVVPRLRAGALTVSPAGSAARLGLGARFAFATGWRRVHTVSVSAFERALPTITARGVVGGDTIELRALSTRVRGWRVTAGGRAGGFDLETGAGADFARSSARIFVALAPERCLDQPGCRGEPFDDGFRQRPVLGHLFLTAARRMGGVTWAAEVGLVSGSGISTFNTFDGDRRPPLRARAALGARVGG